MSDSSTIYQRPEELLQRLIRFDTTNPPGNEFACVQYINGLLQEAGVPVMGATKIYEDNQGCVKLSRDPVNPKRSKHIDVRYHFIRLEQENNQVKILYIPTKDNPADIMTKAVSRDVLQRGTEKMNLF